MTINDLMNARESVSVLYQAKVDGKTALAIRKAVRLMQTPLVDYDEALKAWVNEQEIDGKQIADLTPVQREYWEGMITAEVEKTWEAPLSVENLESVELSAAQIDSLILAGLVSEE